MELNLGFQNLQAEQIDHKVVELEEHFQASKMRFILILFFISMQSLIRRRQEPILIGQTAFLKRWK
jgi:hypothetical protein